MRVLIALLSLFLTSGTAVAGDLTVSVRDAEGRAVRDAVVTLHPSGGVPRGPIRFSWPLRMTQQDLQFQPFVLIVPVGGTVSFPNLDRVRHHVYSFSRGQRFEIELYGRDETKSHTFRAVGVAAIGCNIHDQMVGYIKVVDTPWAARSGSDGNVTLTNVPAGGATMRVWHPRLNVRGNETAEAVTVAAAGGRRTFSGDFSARAAVR